LGALAALAWVMVRRRSYFFSLGLYRVKGRTETSGLFNYPPKDELEHKCSTAIATGSHIFRLAFGQTDELSHFLNYRQSGGASDSR